jgi:hypothetical protein
MSPDSPDSFTSLADNEAWLAENFDKMVRVQDDVSAKLSDQRPYAMPASPVIAAGDEERILRCLGASLITRWNTIPAKLQRELFDTAGSMGDLLDTAELRGQIARFLHKHKNDPAV